MDVFSLGVTLFALLFGHYPFFEATGRDPVYSKKMMSTDSELAFKIHQAEDVCNMSNELQCLLLSMLAYDPQTRPTMQELKRCEWLSQCDQASQS